ncbi:SLUR1 protein, partial [Pterocles burchelli]|nr:SLUR1 protein [Pterocles burchelli]
AQSLRCYTCKNQKDIAECRTITICPPSARVCTTTMHSVDSGYPFFLNVTVTRGCADECIHSNAIGATRHTSCCYTDLC